MIKATHTATLRAFWLTLKAWIKTKLILAIGVTLGVASLVSIGPLLQEALIALFDVSKESLYESLVPDGIALDSGPKRWILSTFETPWIITALVAALISIHMKRWRSMVIALGITVAAVLTVLDVVYGIMHKQLTLTSFTINASSNILGGLAISAVFFLTLWASLFVGRTVGAEQKYQAVVTATVATALGFGTSLVLYVVIATVLQPLEVQARVLAKLPTNGVIGKTYTTEENSEDRNRFRFIGQRTAIQSVVLNGTKGLNWEWLRAEQNTRFSATLHAVQGCSTIKQVQRLAMGRPIKETADAERLRITVDGFISGIELNGQQFGISVQRGTVSHFWIDRSDWGSGVNLTEFLSGGTAILGNTKGDMALLVTATTFQQDDGSGAIRVAPRTFRWQINDEARSIVYKPRMLVDDEEALSCKILEQQSESTNGMTFDNVGLAGLYASIRRTQAPQTYWPSFDGKYEFSQASGWFRRQNIPRGGLRSVAMEELGMIVIETPIHELFVNGEPYAIPTGAGFRGHGKIRASYDEASGLTFSGTFHAAWLDERRLNLTRWERWTFEVKLAVLTLIMSVASTIGTLVYRTRNIWRTYA